MPITHEIKKPGGLSESQIQDLGDVRYLKLDASNDPVTGKLTLTPASGTTALEVNQDIVVLAGKKLIFDGV